VSNYHRDDHRRGATPRWSWKQKQAIVAESVAPRASPTVIARKYGLDTGQLCTWRRQMLRRVPAVAPAGFARVDVVEEPVRPTASTTTTHAAQKESLSN
jgi:transposase-like protein